MAAAEVLLGFGPGHFLIRERAEPDAFLAFRPWLNGLALASAVLLTGAWRTAAAGAALFIITATVAEWHLLSVTGGPHLMVLACAAGLRQIGRVLLRDRVGSVDENWVVRVVLTKKKTQTTK